MTLTFDLEKFVQGQNFGNKLMKTFQNMLGYYAQAIIYCWHQRSRSMSSKKGQIDLIALHLIVTETSNLVHILVYKKPHQV